MEPEPAYTAFGDGIRDCGRDIVFSLCDWGHKDPWTWGRKAGGQLWRTTGDIVDRWGSVYELATRQVPLAQYAGRAAGTTPTCRRRKGRLGAEIARLEPHARRAIQPHQPVVPQSAPLILAAISINSTTSPRLADQRRSACGQSGRGGQTGRARLLQGTHRDLDEGNVGRQSGGRRVQHGHERPRHLRRREFTLKWT